MSTNFDRKVAKSIDSRTWVDRRFLDTYHNHITSFICVLYGVRHMDVLLTVFTFTLLSQICCIVTYSDECKTEDSRPCCPPLPGAGMYVIGFQAILGL